MAAAASKNVGQFKKGRAELAELSALADGTLDPARRDAVEARIAASPELRRLYERERRVVGMLRDEGSSTRAPAALRAQINADRARTPRILLRPAYGAALSVALAVLLLSLLLVSPAGTPGAPTVGQAAGLAALGPSAPPPASSARSVELGSDVEGIYFPNWSSEFGWRAVGQRADHINARLARTVYYAWHGRRIAYTIVAAPALAQPTAAVSRVTGTELRTLTLSGRTVVTWRRGGHTCVLSGVGVPSAELEQLAAWRVSGLDRA
jgi:anti-sigma factor RsiW